MISRSLLRSPRRRSERDFLTKPRQAALAFSEGRPTIDNQRRPTGILARLSCVRLRVARSNTVTTRRSPGRSAPSRPSPRSAEGRLPAGVSGPGVRRNVPLYERPRLRGHWNESGLRVVPEHAARRSSGGHGSIPSPRRGGVGRPRPVSRKPLHCPCLASQGPEPGFGVREHVVTPIAVEVETRMTARPSGLPVPGRRVVLDRRSHRCVSVSFYPRVANALVRRRMRCGRVLMQWMLRNVSPASAVTYEAAVSSTSPQDAHVARRGGLRA